MNNNYFDNFDTIDENNIIANKYVLLNQVGKGSFGNVFKGIYKNRRTDEFVAIKMEDANSQMSSLKHETTILQYLNENRCYNIPSVHWYGIENEKRILVLSYYDTNLLEYYKNCENKVAKLDCIMYNIIRILNSVHKYFVIHRDIKPQNFMIRQGEIYLIDFGLASFYIDDNKKHVLDFGSHDTIIGSPRFVSYFIHAGYSPSRRDDMISLGYMYMSLLKGNLIWDFMNWNIDKTELMNKTSVLSNNNIQRKEFKSWISIEPVLINSNIQILNFMKHCYSLDYSGTPNYDGLSDLFIDNK